MSLPAGSLFNPFLLPRFWLGFSSFAVWRSSDSSAIRARNASPFAEDFQCGSVSAAEALPATSGLGAASTLATGSSSGKACG